MTNNYILCRWRDAVGDPPMEGTVHIVVTAEGRVLDITAIPGVPREAVQAAVDEIASHKFQLVWWQSPEDILSFHTGVTPSDVKESSATQDIRPVEFRRGVTLPRKFEEDDDE